MEKNIIKLSLIATFALTLLLTGCWDYRDINERTITLGVGLDRINGDIEFANEMAQLQTSTPKQNRTVPSNYFYLAKGKDFEKTRADSDRKEPNPDFLGAVRVVAFSKNYAQQGIESYLNRIDRLVGYRKSTLVVISREPPRELLKTKVVNDISTAFAIEDTLDQLTRNGAALFITIKDVLKDLEFGQIGSLLPYVGKEKDTVKFLGFGVLKNGRFIDVMESKDTPGVLYLLSKQPVSVFTLPGIKNKKNKFSFQVKMQKRKIKTSYQNKQIGIDIRLKFNANLQYQYHYQPISDQEIKQLEKMMEDKLKKDVLSVINKSQKKYKTDLFGFARYFRADYPAVYKNMDWTEEYPQAKINVNVKVKITGFNLSDPNGKLKY